MVERTTPAVFGSFAGIVTASPESSGSHVRQGDDRAVVVLVFTDDIDGRTAHWAVDVIFSRLGHGQRFDGRAPVYEDASLAGDSETPNAHYYDCTKPQLARFCRALAYASARLGEPPRAELTTTPLSFLLSHAFCAFDRDCRAAVIDAAEQPSLGIWSNVLRVVGETGLPTRELPQRAVLSKRGVRAVLRDLDRLQWVRTEKRGRTNHLYLTEPGRRAADAGARLVDDVERDWRQRFGDRRLRALRDALVALVTQFDIELPWCLTGYGPGDASITGGSYIAAQTGPPRTPHHGEDWPVVLRETDTAADLPVSALLSQALAMFTIDYEWDIQGYAAGLYWTTNLLRFIGDEGLPLRQAAALGDVTGNGKSGTERHFVTILEPGRPKDGKRKVYLTPKGKYSRDSFAYLVMAVERDWQTRYGACVARLRTALEALATDLDADRAGLPNYPNTTEWYWRSMLLGSAAHRNTSR